ncbi:MAG: Hsp70 family protein [Candidatus Methanomethylophilaceae archaeon]|nr:Hsp70 family protein [Candidatus Methanomethylophilaceae archaeon]
MIYDIGIDLGTTYSCLAIMNATGSPTVVKNNQEHDTTPSVITYDNGEFCVGETAKDQAPFAECTVEAVKRNMSEADTWRMTIGGKEYGPIELSARIVRKLVDDFLEKYPDAELKSATITCPAYFGPKEREATRQAGIIAGFEEVNIIEEPTAAAISYGLKNSGEKNILVYDLGGGTFDVTIMRVAENKFKVLSTDGDCNLGGKDWDAALIEIIKQKVCENGNLTIEELESDDDALTDIRTKAEGQKISLSSLKEVKGAVRIGTSTVKYVVSREEFEMATAGELQATMMKVDSALESAKLTMDDIDDIVLVGGSTRMPQVKAGLISTYPSCESKIHVHDPDLAVATGAAIYQNTRDVEVENVVDPVSGKTVEGKIAKFAPTMGSIEIEKVLSHTMGVKVWDNVEKKDLISNIIFKNCPLPIKNKGEYCVNHDHQTALNVQIFQSDFEESDDNREVAVEECEEVGSFLVDIPSDSCEGEAVFVTIEANEKADIICTCTFRDITKSHTLAAKGLLNDEQIRSARKSIMG